MTVPRSVLGLPLDWNRIDDWLYSVPIFSGKEVSKSVIVKKCAEIKKLKDYSSDPGQDFWQSFPSRPLPTSPDCKVNVKNLADFLNSKKSLLLNSEVERANRCINYLVMGAPAFQKGSLPGCMVENASCTLKHGEYVNDTVAWWVKSGFACGPFKNPPLKNIRVNPMLAIDQGKKIRPVLNISEPKPLSYNSNVNEKMLEKVVMSTAKKFSYSAAECGYNSVMIKTDFVDAYKIIPCKIDDLRLQAFKWLNMFFIETRLIFGAKTAVANFDVFSNTIFTLANCNLKIPKRFFHRTLDHVPLVCPGHLNWCDDFLCQFKDICKSLNVDLADDCDKFEKAFSKSSYGKVLGIYFDLENLLWRFPEEQVDKTLVLIEQILNSNSANLLQMQKLLGRLNYVAQMMPFLRGFKFPLNDVLKQASNSNSIVQLSVQARKDLYVWANFLLDPEKWNPIAHMHYSPPLGHLTFISDASGKTVDRSGCGCIGLSYDELVCFAYQLIWARNLFLKCVDSKGAELCNKTVTLEMIGILIPFLVIPEKLCNQYIVSKVDNIGCYFGWVNKQTANDEMASIVIRSLHLISNYLSCIVHMEHLPRLSTREARMVDRMSRIETTTKGDRSLLDSFRYDPLPQCFVEWMENP
jgi:hypothetical protein